MIKLPIEDVIKNLTVQKKNYQIKHDRNKAEFINRRCKETRRTWFRRIPITKEYAEGLYPSALYIYFPRGGRYSSFLGDEQSKLLNNVKRCDNLIRLATTSKDGFVYVTDLDRRFLL